MLERLKYHWLVLKGHLRGNLWNFRGSDLMSDYCFFCTHYYDKKCSGRYCPTMECKNFERLK